MLCQRKYTTTLNIENTSILVVRIHVYKCNINKLKSVTTVTEYYLFKKKIIDQISSSFSKKNIRNNWITEKTQTLRFTDPDTGKTLEARWRDLIKIYKEESETIIKNTKLDYSTLYPTNLEKEKVHLACNIFNEKTSVELLCRGNTDAAVFVEAVTKLWNILNIKNSNADKRSIGLPIEIRELIRQKRHHRRLWQRTRIPQYKTNANRLQKRISKDITNRKKDSWEMYCDNMSFQRVKMPPGVKSGQSWTQSLLHIFILPLSPETKVG